MRQCFVSAAVLVLSSIGAFPSSVFSHISADFQPERITGSRQPFG